MGVSLTCCPVWSEVVTWLPAIGVKSLSATKSHDVWLPVAKGIM